MMVNKYKTPMVIIDSLTGAHQTNENTALMGRVLKNIAEIAERTHAAFPLVHHTRKLMIGEEITANSCRGSNAILAMMVSMIGIDQPNPDSKACRMRVLKENLGINPRPVGFEVTDAGLVFAEAPQKPKEEKETAKDRAAKFLLRHMAETGKGYKASEVIEAAEQNGFTKETLHRAKEALGIVVAKVGEAWEWTRPNQDSGGKS
jgi:hypothetical protein